MTATTRSAAAIVSARLLATLSLMTTGLGPLLLGLELLLAPPAASSFRPTGMHMPGGVDSEISFRAVVLVVTAGAGVALALVARRIARGDRVVGRAIEVNVVALVVVLLLGPLVVRGLWAVAGVMAR